MNLKNFRIDNDIKQVEIAKILGITQQQYSLYENEYRSIPVDLVIKLCRYYHVSSDYILGI